MREYFEFSKGGIYHIKPPKINSTACELIEKTDYILKTEFHITLIGAKYSDLFNDGRRRQQISKIAESVRGLDYVFDKCLYSVSRPKLINGQEYDRQSLVAPINSAQLKGVLNQIIDDLQVDIPQQFLHVTIATKPDTKTASLGIGINSEAEWQSLEPKIFQTDWLER